MLVEEIEIVTSAIYTLYMDNIKKDLIELFGTLFNSEYNYIPCLINMSSEFAPNKNFKHEYQVKDIVSMLENDNSEVIISDENDKITIVLEDKLSVIIVFEKICSVSMDLNERFDSCCEFEIVID